MDDGNQKKEGQTRGTTGISVTEYSGRGSSQVPDLVAVEEPLEIFVNNNLFHTTMRSPGEEMLLALGYLFTRGAIKSIDDILGLTYCKEDTGNRIDLFLPPSNEDREGNTMKPRASVAYSSCGICGTDIIKDMCAFVPKKEMALTIEIAKIVQFHQIMENRQDIFRGTGGTHAAAIFSRSGDFLAFSEDVGRHNALDKAIGLLVAERRLKDAGIVVLTSRLSYEMVQKVSRINAEILIGVSSATSLAIGLAEALNLTLVGFSRKDKGVIYTCPERILLDRS
jgi:FdhD protein